ncbi:MAG TPA: ClpX C4-type zinc finger protein [bacterium]|nr:ClpX C4-type zinc finger protein [bacterium]
MADKDRCLWCGRSRDETERMFTGPVVHICGRCVEKMAGVAHEEEVSLAERVKEEIDSEVQESFKKMVSQLKLGPLQDKYQRLVRVKFREDAGSPTFQEVFEEFKKGVQAEVREDDYECRYDLAIAYHEMGLIEDAFREMLASLDAAFKKKDFDRASEVMSALLYFHDDSARVIKGIARVIGGAGIK